IGQQLLPISQFALTLPATTYARLSKLKVPNKPTLRLGFASPTSFRSKGHHLPLPIPRNLFHSYLRRWNDLSGRSPIEMTPFLDWIDQVVIIQNCQVRSLKVAAGKRGAVTGFVGAIELGLAQSASDIPKFVQLFYTLGHFSPYCGTGHKTTFGLGQTRLGWTEAETSMMTLDPASHTASQLLAQRIDELTERFIAQRQRQGGDRARNIAEKWATILARREIGDSLQQIAMDMGLAYETARTYSKRARREIRQGNRQ
ncbi:MAG: CRISPR system precrRNA processing endoribonuclease RAMP protein Cas6, partial [Merismopedia sp. SIO2A8]|nr:CRISPR system precrRNA processing endoribonuclease RAMP protein Cas6 [Merismopedia sp. SIO2A8]